MNKKITLTVLVMGMVIVISGCGSNSTDKKKNTVDHVNQGVIEDRSKEKKEKSE